MKENHHLKSFCKNFSRKTVTLSITVLLLFTLSFGALAASYTVYSNVTTTKVARLATKGDCGGVGGIAIGKNKNSMFCIKTNTGTDQEAKFYYIPDLDNVSSETTRITTIKGAGHANAMAIDGTYVYITCWMDAKGHENENKNQIMLIPRKVIASTANGGEIKAATDDTSGYKILTAKVKNTDASTKDTNPYVDYNKAIRSITLHKSNGKFIIGYDVGDDSKNYYYYTTAKLITYNGEEIFLVSEDPNDIFAIKNNVKFKYGVGQDICYSSGNGFFKSVWYYRNTKKITSYENYSYAKKNKSIILWADIDSDTSLTVTVNGVTYRLYNTDVISIDKSNSTYNGITKFEKFEIESIAFTKEGDMLAAFNIENTQAYIDAYNAKNNDDPPADTVFKITHDSGEKFVLK